MSDTPWLQSYDAGVPHSLHPYPDRTLVDVLRETARERPDHPALLFKGSRMTCRDLDRATDAFAASLVASGVKKGDRVAMLLPWGRIWSPSADSAARMTISTPVTVNGAALPAGTNGIWAIPDSASSTVIFSGSAAAFHLRYPDGHDVLRVHAAPQRGDQVESLLFAFPMVDSDSAVLQLRWGTTVVPLSIHAASDGTR